MGLALGLVGCGGDDGFGPAYTTGGLPTSGAEATDDDPDDGPDDASTATAAEPDGSSDGSGDAQGESDDTSSTGTGAVECVGFSPDAPWIDSYTSDLVARLSGAAELSPGVTLFDRATPDGYPNEDAPYADSNAMLQRWQFARSMEWTLWRLLPQPWIGNEREGRDAWARQLAQAAAVRLTGSPLGEQSMEACVQFARASEGATWERALQLVTFVGQLPEASRH